MAVQTVFQRYEMKYLLTQAQREAVLRALEPHMALDPYGRTVIRNLYLDTGSYRLIRRSIEKPVYKEKMRIRCYGPAHPDSPVFVELKKKYKKVVYKRRLSLPEREAMDWVLGRRACPAGTQISEEVDYFLRYYAPLLPAGTTLMEIKCSGGIPLWLTHVLSAQGVRQTSFSKYGTAYQTLIYPNLQKEAVRYA